MLNAIESRARIADKNGKSYIHLKVTQSFTFTRSSDYVGECLCRAFIKYELQEMNYIALTEGTFKQRYNQHNYSSIPFDTENTPTTQSSPNTYGS